MVKNAFGMDIGTKVVPNTFIKQGYIRLKPSVDYIFSEAFERLKSEDSKKNNAKGQSGLHI